jgi:outer membrane protein OmpA-like peptidoglycan-associated protein
MSLSKWMAATVLALFVVGTASAGSYQEYQADFLKVAAQEEAAEEDFRGEKDFQALADLAGSRVVTLDDAPDKWRNRLKVKRANRAAMRDRLLELEARVDGLSDAMVAVNAEAVAHAFVDLLHARHELSEPGIHVLDADTYLDHAAADLSSLKPADRDGDGITDDRDKCPDDPEDRDGFQDSDGCPDPDNDRDGVPDYRDGCPNEPETFNRFLDEDGCPDVALAPVYFDSDSSVLDADARSTLSANALSLRESPDVQVRIDGHCDSRNSDSYNERLGRRRSVAVRDYLVNELGIDATRFGIATLGESQPAADNDSREGRRLNRRVEFTIID